MERKFVGNQRPQKAKQRPKEIKAKDARGRDKKGSKSVKVISRAKSTIEEVPAAPTDDLEKRISLLEVLREHLSDAGRFTYIHRLIYFGLHSYLDNESELKSLLQANVQEVGENQTETVTGYFICYTRHFIHFIEGPEFILARHVIKLLDSVNEGCLKLEKMKLLTLAQHISQRYFNRWLFFEGNPTSVMPLIEETMDENECIKYMKKCLEMMFNVAECLQDESEIEVDAIVGPYLSEPVLPLLPEVSLLVFLSDLDMVYDLEFYSSTFMKLPKITFYDDVIWPIGTEYVPYYILSPSCIPTYRRVPPPEPPPEIEQLPESPEANAAENPVEGEVGETSQ